MVAQVDFNTDRSDCLLLGMVFGSEKRAKRGQEYRDRVRCEALENIGYNVKTLDNKHTDLLLEKHCQASFTDSRRMMTSMREKWGEGSRFNHIILDYFFSPVIAHVLVVLSLCFHIIIIYMCAYL